MKLPLSGTSLFHFTNSFDNIVSILKNGFYPRLCFEEGIIEKPAHALPDSIVPMVCFCDMRLSDADKGRHTIDYGNFAIGVTKPWAKSYGICPVLYSWPLSESENKKSFAFTERAMGLIFGNLLKEMNRSKDTNVKESLMNIREGLGVLLSYTKRYEGHLYKNFVAGTEIVRFYDEREWRYVPIVLNINGENRFIYDILINYIKDANAIFYSNEPLSLRIDDKKLIKIDKSKYIELQNEQLKVQALRLTGKDITYIIVENKEDILKMRKQLSIMRNVKSHANSISIFSFEDIRNDY